MTIEDIINQSKSRLLSEGERNLLLSALHKSRATQVPTHPMIQYVVAKYPRIMKMKNPLTDEQADALLKEFDKRDLDKIFALMENCLPLLKKYVSANLTIRNWMARDLQDKRPANKATGLV